MVAESNANSLEIMAKEIRVIYKSDPMRAERLIHTYLEQRLKELSPDERLEHLEKLTHRFKDLDPVEKEVHEFESNEISRLIFLLLGDRIPVEDHSSNEMIDKLASSLDTIFTTVNRIVSVIHTTLLGEHTELETIRTIISSRLRDEGRPESLKGYLDQIQEAFLIAHRAYQQAACAKVQQILDEMDPEHISSIAKGSFTFGPLRKAELYAIYGEKFQACKGWFESGRFKDDFMREFEKNCQKAYKIDI